MGLLAWLFGRKPASKGNDLLAAALHGDVALAKAALENGADINGSQSDGPPPLVLALVKGRDDVAEFLIKNGADVDRPDPRGGMRPLHAAALHGNEALVRLLIEHGATVDARCGQPPLTAMAFAFRHSHVALGRLLLEAGADPNSPIALPSDPPDQQQLTLLIYAASTGDVALIRMLTRHGADLNLPKADGLTPLMAAAFQGQENAVKALVESGASVDVVHAGDSSRPFSALDLAIARNNVVIVEYLRAKGASSAVGA